jgi:hypothetical protein
MAWYGKARSRYAAKGDEFVYTTYSTSECMQAHLGVLTGLPVNAVASRAAAALRSHPGTGAVPHAHGQTPGGRHDPGFCA